MSVVGDLLKHGWVRLLGEAVVLALWQGALVAAASAVLLALLRRAAAEWRHAVALAGLTAMVVVPIATLRSHRANGRDLSSIAALVPTLTFGPSATEGVLEEKAPPLPQRETLSGRASRSESTNVATPPGKAGRKWTFRRVTAGIERRLPLLGAFWLVGVGLVAGWQGIGIVFALSLKRRGVTAAAPEFAEALHRLQKRAGWRKAVRLLDSARVRGPVAIGWLKPAILLPVGLACQMPAAQIEALIAHELAHLRRCDPWLALIQAFLETVLFFHPAAWWLSRTIRREREHICDDLAAEWCGDPRTVAEALGRLAAGSWSGLAFQGGGGSLVHRVRRLLRSEPAVLPGRRVPGLVLLFATVTLGASLLASRSRADATGPAAVRGTILDRNGVVLAESGDDGSRRYPLRALGATIVGSVRAGRKPGSTAWQGLLGIEKSHDSDLVAGHAVRLAIDARLQAIVEGALRDARVGRGAAVVIDPRNGEVLAMASVPSFDSQIFSPKLEESEWKSLLEDPTGPLLNRALAPYSPGSIFKLVTAAAGIGTGQADKLRKCDGVLPIGDRSFRCWSDTKGFSHGNLDLPAAIENSCNCYFFALGIEVGSEHFCEVAGRLGVGVRSGVDLPNDSAGNLLPSQPEEARHPWRPAAMANASIGQGPVRATPLQMAVVAGAIANGGNVWVPRVAIAIGGKPTEPQLRSRLFDDDRTAKIEMVRKGMIRVVNSGTGKRAAIQGLEIGGKTGTAQGWRDPASPGRTPDNKVWFAGFADDAEKPLAFSIMVENGYAGGATCAPIARQIVGQWFRPKDFPPPPTAPLDPAKGHFDEVRDGRFPEAPKGEGSR